MQIQRTLPGPDDIGAFAADHLPYQLPAVASLAHDLLDVYAVLRQRQDGHIGLLAAQVALILEALGCCQQLGMDRGRTDDGANLAHRFCGRRRGRPDWRSPSDASGRRPVPRVAGPLLPLRHIRRHDKTVTMTIDVKTEINSSAASHLAKPNGIAGACRISALQTSTSCREPGILCNQLVVAEAVQETWNFFPVGQAVKPWFAREFICYACSDRAHPGRCRARQVLFFR
jgi:hypothetical protein